MTISREQLLDKISELLVESGFVGSEEYLRSQQFKLDNGRFSKGREENQEMVVFDSDTLANSEDSEFVDELIMNLGDVDVNQLGIEFGSAEDGNYGYVFLTSPSLNTPVQIPPALYNNVSQFLNFNKTSQIVDNTKAKEILDTTIYELIPNQKTRQQKINDFFKSWTDLKGNVPNFTSDIDGDGVADTFGTDYDSSIPGNEEEIEEAQNQHNQTNDIDPSIDPDLGNIVRLDRHAVDTQNEGQTLETLWREISQYLSDLKDFEPIVEDERPEYENKTGGYLKIRKLNQSIMIRKQEGSEIGLEREVSGEIIVGENQDPSSITGPSYLVDGFTITQWVKFLDATDEPNYGIGTLFNYGNPMRVLDPKGFRLETYVINKDNLMNVETPHPTDGTMALRTWGEWAEQNYIGPNPFFQESNYERFLRLVVYDHINDNLYGSHTGIPGQGILGRTNNFPQFGFEYNAGINIGFEPGFEGHLICNKRVPIDFSEWYFIVATYNPNVIEEVISDFSQTPEYWLGHISGGSNASPVYTDYSGRGSKCKIEIISKTDLLRARGFKV
tara:strand:+ start:4703 stop:6373 length:1671 start_codon:yes stop_codon:yes gene_type:complete